MSMALACVSCGALTRTAKAYGFSVLAIIGRCRIDVGRSRITLPLVGPSAYGLLHPWTCRSSHRRSSWWCLLPSSCWSPRWCLLPSASGLMVFPPRSAPHRTAGPQARYKGKTNAGPSAMANDTLINLLAWCKRERERLQMQREMLQSGRFRIFEKDDSDQQRDISNQHIEQIGANISELDRIIMADYEAKSV